MARIATTLGLVALLLSPTAWANDEAEDAPVELPDPPPAPSGAAASGPVEEPESAPAGPRVIWQNAPPAASEPFLPDAPRAEEPRRVPRWYGSEILAVDGASAGAIAAGISSQLGPLALLGFGGYVLGGPIVHWSHGNAGRGFASLSLRIGLPVVGIMTTCRNDGGGECYAGVAGLAVGVAGAMVIDSALLARDEVPAPPPATARVTPLLGVSRSGMRLGLAGSF